MNRMHRMHSMNIPRKSNFQKQSELDVYSVDGTTYEYPCIGRADERTWYVWFKHGLDILCPSEYGLDPNNTIVINNNTYTIDSVVFIRNAKKGIFTVI